MFLFALNYQIQLTLDKLHQANIFSTWIRRCVLGNQCSIALMKNKAIQLGFNLWNATRSINFMLQFENCPRCYLVHRQPQPRRTGLPTLEWVNDQFQSLPRIRSGVTRAPIQRKTAVQIDGKRWLLSEDAQWLYSFCPHRVDICRAPWWPG